MFEFLLGLISIIFVIGAWLFSKKYENDESKKNLCYIGFGSSITSILFSIYHVIANIGIMQYMDALEQQSRSRYGEHYDAALLMTATGGEWYELWGTAFLRTIFFIIWIIVSFFACKRYRKAITYRNAMQQYEKDKI